MARKSLDSVRSALREVNAFASAQEIYAALAAQPRPLGLTTVYRCLRTLVDAQEVDFIRRGDGEGAYRYCGPAHHHHLVCRQCGETVEIGADVVETWAQKVATTEGFRNVVHSVELSGLCPRC